MEDPIFRSLAVIEERIQEKLTVEALAQSAHFSKYHYQRLFREAVGESVMRYVARRRMALAARDLAETDAAVLDIALKYGYDSHEGFSRAFQAVMGAAPAKFRRYCGPVRPSAARKENETMAYKQINDEAARELRGLLVQAGETADRTRREARSVPAYAPFWELMAAQAEALAGTLSGALERLEGDACPDGLSACLQTERAIEDAAFQAGATAFQAGLMTARAVPEHRAVLLPMAERFKRLAGAARAKAGRIAGSFRDLASLIFQDMREEAAGLLQAAVRAGRDAAAGPGGPALPYGYIAGALTAMAGALAAAPLEEVTAQMLEDCLFRLKDIALAAEVDLLRCHAHRPLFAGIETFRKRLEEAEAFFRQLSWSFAQPLPEADSRREASFQADVVLFYLAGELQKLSPRLEEARRTALAAACGELDEALRLPPCPERGERVRAARAALLAEAERLEGLGEALRFIAGALEEDG